MNAPTNAVRPPKVDDQTEADAIRESIVKVRTAVARLLYAASMQRERALSPNWDTDMQDPAIVISNAVSLIESTLDLEDPNTWRIWTTKARDAEESGKP